MEVRRTARARHVAGMPPWWSSRLVSMLRLFQRDGPLSGPTPLLLDHGWTLEPRSCLSECRRDRSHRARPWRRDAYAALPQPLIVILSSAMITWSNATSSTPSPLDAFSAVRSWVGCTNNMSGFDLRQAQVAIALLGNRAEAFLSTCGVLPRYQSDPGCKLASGLERFWIGHR